MKGKLHRFTFKRGKLALVAAAVFLLAPLKTHASEAHPREACVTSFSASQAAFTAYGASSTVFVGAPSACSWSIQKDASFVTVINGVSRTGSVTVTFVIAPNDTAIARTATLTVEDRELVIVQSAPRPATLTYVSDKGDYIGQGLTFVDRAPTATFSATLSNDLRTVLINIDGPTLLSSYYWRLNLSMPIGRILAVGSYENATRYPFQASTAPGLDFSGTGRGCNNLSGRFDILELEFASDFSLKRLKARFEQHCEGQVPALRGELSYGTASFTDDTIVAGVTPIKAIHFTELRTRIDKARARFGLGVFAYSSTPTAGTSIIPADLAEMRAALAEAFVAAKITPPVFTDPVLSVATPIKLLHLAELRLAVGRLE